MKTTHLTLVDTSAVLLFRMGCDSHGGPRRRPSKKLYYSAWPLKHVLHIRLELHIEVTSASDHQLPVELHVFAWGRWKWGFVDPENKN